jgi:hypothetical protein
MNRFRRQKGRSPGEFVQDALWRVASAVHIGFGRAISLLLRGIGKFSSFLPWSGRLGLMAAVCGGLLLQVGLVGDLFYVEFSGFEPAHRKLIEDLDALATFQLLQPLMVGVGILLVLGAFLAFLRVRFSLLVLKTGAAGYLVLNLWFLLLLYQIPALLAVEDGKSFDKYARNELWQFWTYLWIPCFLPGVLLTVCLCLRRVSAFYAGRDASQDGIGDRICRNLATNGPDPRFRTSWYWSAFLHLSVIVLIPLLLRGCMLEAYKIPKGDGAVVQYVKIKPVKKKPKEQYVFNPNSPISYYRPELDDKHLEEMDKLTDVTYQATSLMGKKTGKSGKPGWPNGMDDAKIRFIRLKYSGGNWDLDMGKDSDYNMLLKIRDATGFRIADNTEAIEISDLRRFPKRQAPPFVFITGQGNINANSKEIAALRWYLLEEGGMIFADNAGGNFNASFRALMRRIVPDKEWIDISNDDILYQHPFIFPNGAPPLWHHSGYRALGMKHNGRWIVFYHQGDIHDAWKTGGSGASEELREQAFKMGINVINYAFTQYLSQHFGEE